MDEPVGMHKDTMLLAGQPHFVYGRNVDAGDTMDTIVSRIAAAIGEPARTRMLFCLMDGHARTSTELAIVGAVSPSTASAHLNRLQLENLVKVTVQGRYRYFSLRDKAVARALENLSVVAGRKVNCFVPATPTRLRLARSCYDHMAGTVAVALHDRFIALRWIQVSGTKRQDGYELTIRGTEGFESLGIRMDETQALRRRILYGCLDWSERRPHLAGALGAALLNLTLTKRWVARDLDSRALTVTSLGRRELSVRVGLQL